MRVVWNIKHTVRKKKIEYKKINFNKFRRKEIRKTYQEFQMLQNEALLWTQEERRKAYKETLSNKSIELCGQKKVNKITRGRGGAMMQ